MKFASTVVVENLREDTRMSIEEEFVKNRIIIGKGFRQAWQPCGRDLFQCGAVGFETKTAHVQYNSILAAVHVTHTLVPRPRSYHKYPPEYFNKFPNNLISVETFGEMHWWGEGWKGGVSYYSKCNYNVKQAIYVNFFFIK